MKEINETIKKMNQEISQMKEEEDTPIHIEDMDEIKEAYQRYE